MSSEVLPNRDVLTLLIQEHTQAEGCLTTVLEIANGRYLRRVRQMQELAHLPTELDIHKLLSAIHFLLMKYDSLSDAQQALTAQLDHLIPLRIQLMANATENMEKITAFAQLYLEIAHAQISPSQRQGLRDLEANFPRQPNR